MAALMLLTASAGWKRFSWFPGTIVGPLLVATINPQYVNISALYSGALLMVTAVMLVGSDKKTSFPSPLLMGLVLGSMVALKLTFAVFVALYFPFVVLACKGGQQSWKPALKWAAAELAWMSAFLAVFLDLVASTQLPGPRFAPPQPSIPPVPVGGLNLVSLDGLFYGASFFDYTAVVLAAGTIAVLGLIAQRSETDPRKRQASFGILGGAVAGVLSYVATVLGLGIAFGYAQSLRLATPSMRRLRSRHRHGSRARSKLEAAALYLLSFARRDLYIRVICAFNAGSLPASGAFRFDFGILRSR